MAWYLGESVRRSCSSYSLAYRGCFESKEALALVRPTTRCSRPLSGISVLRVRPRGPLVTTEALWRLIAEGRCGICATTNADGSPQLSNIYYVCHVGTRE